MPKICIPFALLALLFSAPNACASEPDDDVNYLTGPVAASNCNPACDSVTERCVQISDNPVAYACFYNPSHRHGAANPR